MVKVNKGLYELSVQLCVRFFCVVRSTGSLGDTRSRTTWTLYGISFTLSVKKKKKVIVSRCEQKLLHLASKQQRRLESREGFMEFQSISPPTAHPPLETKHGGLMGRPESPQIPSSAEMGQMVCGVCRGLVSYPTPARHVKCPSCQTVNYILEGFDGT
ncbi:hypothetical protein Sjap_000227 [Stephania japonica]|uniref:Zinc finger LSD1-type domain-containing protein n=1 Tax=Stephania japonica TaxID=461633 RepID=A0AAP0KK09_9MAGN